MIFRFGRNEIAFSLDIQCVFGSSNPEHVCFSPNFFVFIPTTSNVDTGNLFTLKYE